MYDQISRVWLENVIVSTANPSNQDTAEGNFRSLLCSGEEAFYSMQYFFGWAQYPMLPRLVSSRLSVKVPITIISGERSWLDAINRTRLKKRTAELVKDTCPEGAYVGGATIQGAGHHLHAEKPEEFNSIVKEVLEVVDEERDR